MRAWIWQNNLSRAENIGFDALLDHVLKVTAVPALPLFNRTNFAKYAPC